MQKKVLFALLLFLVSFLNAQTITIQGQVLTSYKKPLMNVSVKLLDTDSLGIVKKFVITDQNGNFSFNLSQYNNNKLWLQISAIGYVTYNNALLTSSNNLLIILEKSVKQLPDIIIKSDLSIYKKGDTTTYKVSSFEQGNENNIADFLAKLPGIQVNENGKVSFNGKLITRVLIENDDLFGNNYESLINNATINGIDKIDVIENFKDNTRIEHNISSSNETVLNLRYKPKKIRTFGNILGSFGFPNNKYELKLNSINLYKKSKLVILSNKNNIGSLSSILFGKINATSLIENENAKVPFGSMQPYIPFSFGDITPLNMSSFRVFDNNSFLANSTFFIKPSTKLQAKITLTSLRDNYLQSNNFTETYFQLPQNFTANQTTFLQKNNKHINTNTELNWSPKEKLQFILQCNYNKIENQQSNDNLFNSVKNNQIINEGIQNNSLNLTATKLFNHISFLQFQYVYSHNAQNNSYNIQNPILDSFFNFKSSFKNYLQSYNQPVNSNKFQISYFNKIKKTSINIKYLFGQDQINLNNNVYAYNTEDSIAYFPNTFYNNSNINITKNELNINVSKSNTFKLQSTIGVALQYININDDVKHTNSSNVFILPMIGFQYKIDNNNSFNFYAQSVALTPSTRNLNNSFIFSNNFTITNSTENLNFNTGYQANFGYSYNNISKGGYLIFASIMLSQQPVNYITNATKQNNILINNIVSSDLVNKTKSINFHFEKNLRKAKSFFIQKISYGNSINNFLIQNLPSQNQFNFINSESRFRSNWKKWLNLNTALIYRLQIQSNKNSSLENNKITNYDFLSNTTLALKVSNNVLLDVQNDLLINHSFANKNSAINFTDIKLKFFASKKLNLDFLARNIFNVNQFSYSEVNTIFSNVNIFSINERFFLFGLNYKF